MESRNILENTTEIVSEGSPHVYSDDNSHFFLNWIAEGADGQLYIVPSEPGGWRNRSKFTGDPKSLKIVSEQKARAIIKFVGAEESRETVGVGADRRETGARSGY